MCKAINLQKYPSCRSRSVHCCCRTLCRSSASPEQAALPFSSASAEFINHLKASGRAVTTIDCYRGCLKRLQSVLGECDVSEISTTDLENAVNRLRLQRACTEVTWNKIKSSWRSFFSWLHESGHILYNPALRLKFARATSLPTIPISMDEVTTILDTIRQSGDSNASRDELLFAIYAFTGLRKAEALKLKVRDYDSTAKVLYVSNAKAGRRRVQPVPTNLSMLLERYIAKFRFNATGGDDVLFPDQKGERSLSARQSLHRFAFWKQNSGIRPSLTIRSFRAGFATILYQATGNIWLVVSALGHRGVQTIHHYLQADVNELRRAIEWAYASNF